MATFLGAARMPGPASVPTTDAQERVVFMASSLLLDYPGEEFFDRLRAVEAAAGELPSEIREALAAFARWARAHTLTELQIHYVETFDQRRRCTLSLSYYTHGDTRGRGHAILAFKELLASEGFGLTREELPDYLPIVAEFAAVCPGDRGREALSAHREGLEVVRSALHFADSGYAHLLDALLMSLPEPSPEVIASFRRLIQQGPPSELVGLAPFGSLAAEPTASKGFES